MKEYEHLDLLPKGQAADHITPGCLVCEGGGWRGVYTQGVLDQLMQADLSLQCTIGTSAGALMAVNYLSGQIGRGPYITLKYRHDPSFVGLKALHESHSIAGFRFMHETVETIWPTDYERFYNPARRLVCVATDCESGAPRYFEKGTETFWKGMQAGASVPFVSEMVRIDGRLYLDGGVADPIPLLWAMTQGYEKIVVVLTRMRDGWQEKDYSSALVNTFYRKYPNFAWKLTHRGDLYNRMRRFIDQQEEAGRIFVIAPSKDIPVPLFSGDMEKLGELYWLGWHDTEQVLPQLRAYLQH